VNKIISRILRKSEPLTIFFWAFIGSIILFLEVLDDFKSKKTFDISQHFFHHIPAKK
jgi:hypothetical protein